MENVTYCGNKGKLMKRTCSNCGYRVKKIGLKGSWCLITLKDVKLNNVCKDHETYKEKWS